MLDQTSQPLDTVFVPIGGGSLAAAMGLVFKALSPHTRVIGVQSAAAPAIARAWRTGEMKQVPVGETIADGARGARALSQDRCKSCATWWTT